MKIISSFTGFTQSKIHQQTVQENEDDVALLPVGDPDQLLPPLATRHQATLSPLSWCATQPRT